MLRDRYPFAAEVLGSYLAVLDVWELIPEPPDSDLVSWAASHVVPRVVAATEAGGPELLAKAVAEIEDPAAVLAAWLAGAELGPVERYLARASLPVVPAEACAGDPAPRDGGHCPRCGGLPQVSVRGESGDALVSGGRTLACARCDHSWSFSASACPACGETTGAKRTVYAEQHAGPIVSKEGAATFPHLRIDACASCDRYIIDVDMGRDPRAVPVVDELAALPLALYANDQGLTKITPNLMGL